MLRSVARNFSILTTARVAEALLAFLFIAFIARQFGPELFGKYILINAYVRLVSVLVNAGVAPIAFRELARNRDDAARLFDDIISMRVALGATSYLVLMAVLISFSQDQELLTLMAVAALPLIFNALTDSYAAYYTAHERLGVPGLYAVASTGLAVAAGVSVLLSGFGLLALIMSNVATNLLSTAVWSAVFRTRMLRFRIRARFTEWRRLVMLIIPFAPIHVSNQLNRVLNVVLLGRMPGPIPMEQSVGYYSPAQSITNTIVLLVAGLRRVLIPPVTVRLSEGHAVTREIELTMKLAVVLFCLPLLLGSSFLAPEIISLLFGAQYVPSASALTILGLAGALQIAAMVPESFLFSHPDHKVQDYIPGALISVLTNIALCVLLIGEYGFMGAAAAAVGARAVYFAYAIHYCGQRMGEQALRLRRFGDVAVLLVSAFGVWHLASTWLGNAWTMTCVAVVLTIALIAAFLLHLRARSVAVDAG